jgi:uncharacterized protein YbaR (Trm112 family)
MQLLTPLFAKHLDELVCPVCHGMLMLSECGVDCVGCGRGYPIVDGLPVLIASRASTRPEKA